MSGIRKTRTSTRTPRVDYSGLDQDYVSTKRDPTYKGKRPFGDSGKLARSRYNLKTNHKSKFEVWRKGREAQHLVPASVAKKFVLAKNLIDSYRNGMMLPAYPGALPTISKTRPYHRKSKKLFDHKEYSRSVRLFIKSITKKSGKLNNDTWVNIMDTLRETHKSGNFQFVDDIKTTDMKRVWNSRNNFPKL